MKDCSQTRNHLESREHDILINEYTHNTCKLVKYTLNIHIENQPTPQRQSLSSFERQAIGVQTPVHLAIVGGTWRLLAGLGGTASILAECLASVEFHNSSGKSFNILLYRKFGRSVYACSSYLTLFRYSKYCV